jgi:hypothetical protein
MGITVVFDPNGAWEYSQLTGSAGDIHYYPTHVSSFSGATPQGYVSYATGGDPGRFQDGSSILGYHIFTTFIISSYDQTIPFWMTGDDGHSLFIDDAFVAGGGFGVGITGSIGLAANVERKLTVVAHNSLGLWVAQFLTGDTQDLLLEDTPFLKTSAVSSIPEPSNLIGLAGILGLAIISRRRVRQPLFSRSPNPALAPHARQP